jgi:hypothetical protein
MQWLGVVMESIGESAVHGESKGGRKGMWSPSTRAREPEALMRRGRTPRSVAAIEQEQYASESGTVRPEHSPVHLNLSSFRKGQECDARSQAPCTWQMRLTSMSGLTLHLGPDKSMIEPHLVRIL